MDKILEIRFSGWTATPRLPFVLSGNALCMPVPSYSMILGVIGCCLGRFVSPKEVKVGYQYSYDTTANDMEKRKRLQFDGKKITEHSKGSDAYLREFHTNPHLIIWIDRTDWKEYFECPIGTPSLGRSQDLLKIERVAVKEIELIENGKIKGCMIPYKSRLIIPGQLLQIAEAYEENEEIGSGRNSTGSSMFIAIYSESDGINVKMHNLYKTKEVQPENFYLHSFYES